MLPSQMPTKANREQTEHGFCTCKEPEPEANIDLTAMKCAKCYKPLRKRTETEKLEWILERCLDLAAHWQENADILKAQDERGECRMIYTDRDIYAKCANELQKVAKGCKGCRAKEDA